MLTNWPIKQETKEALKENLKKCAASSTAHALPKLVRYKAKSYLLVWIGIFVLTCSYFSYMCIRNLVDYLQFDVTTNINTYYKQSTLFPSVTICLLNPFSTRFTDEIIHQLKSEFHLSLNFIFSEFS